MDFGQLSEYNMRNIFREKYTKCEETILRAFPKKIQIEHIILIV